MFSPSILWFIFFSQRSNEISLDGCIFLVNFFSTKQVRRCLIPVDAEDEDFSGLFKEVPPLLSSVLTCSRWRPTFSCKKSQRLFSFAL